MRTDYSLSHRSLAFVQWGRRSIRAFLGLIRDMIKGLYLVGIQFWTRLFLVERGSASAISLSARLDVMPRGPERGRYKLKLGRRSLIEASAVICTWQGDVILGDGASVGIGSIVLGPVRIGENSLCSQNCFISGQSHRYDDVSVNVRSQGFNIDPVVVGKNVWIGSNSVILPGVKIGNNTVVGAGSTVIKDIPSYAVAVGNPAKVIKQYDFKARKWLRT